MAYTGQVTLFKVQLQPDHYGTPVHLTSHFTQGNRETRSCLTGHPVREKHGYVLLVTLDMANKRITFMSQVELQKSRKKKKRGGI